MKADRTACIWVLLKPFRTATETLQAHSLFTLLSSDISHTLVDFLYSCVQARPFGTITMATSALSSSVFLFLTAMSAGMWKRLSNSPKTKSKDLAKGVFLAVVVLALFGSQLKSGNGDKWNSVSRESLQQFHDMNYTLASCHNVKTASRNNDSVSHRTTTFELQRCSDI